MTQPTLHGDGAGGSRGSEASGRGGRGGKRRRPGTASDPGAGGGGAPASSARSSPFLPYLLHRAAQRADRLVERRLKPLKLTARQLSVIDAIHEHPGLSQIELGARTGIDRSTVVNIVDRLELRGLVVRNESRFDRRAVALQLSRDGLAVIAQARPWVEDLNVRLLSLLPADGRRDIAALLVALIQADD